MTSKYKRERENGNMEKFEKDPYHGSKEARMAMNPDSEEAREDMRLFRIKDLNLPSETTFEEAKKASDENERKLIIEQYNLPPETTLEEAEKRQKLELGEEENSS